MAGDSVVVFCMSSLIKKLERYFCKPTNVIDSILQTLRN